MADIFTDEDVLLKAARKMPWVDSNYRMDKQWYDNVLAWIWLVPWMTILTKGDKMYTFFKRLWPDDKAYFFQMLEKIANIKWVPKWFIDIIKTKVFKIELWKWTTRKISEIIDTKWEVT